MYFKYQVYEKDEEGRDIPGAWYVFRFIGVRRRNRNGKRVLQGVVLDSYWRHETGEENGFEAGFDGKYCRRINILNV